MQQLKKMLNSLRRQARRKAKRSQSGGFLRQQFKQVEQLNQGLVSKF